MIVVQSVMAGSLAEEMGIVAQDSLLQINDQPLRDLIDFYRALESEQLTIELLRDNEVLVMECTKMVEEDLGVDVEHPKPLQCGNQCLFCFVHQLPKGLRKSLYIKDEDYRFSYLYGSFITLTNLLEEDFRRIEEDQLSPLYISVHATSPEVRNHLLGCQAPDVLPLLQRLAKAGIVLHCQIVLCPGINDKEVLKQTIDNLSTLFPQVASIAVVPVGLTRHRGKLPHLAAVTKVDAEDCLVLVDEFQQQLLSRFKHRLIYAADEFYLLAQREVPPLDAYEDLPQLENGVGLLAQFRSQAEEVLIEAEPLDVDAVVLVTGHLFQPELQKFADRLSLRTDVKLEALAINNQLFGSRVSVAGLIPGRDLLEQLRQEVKGRAVLIPEVMLKSGQQVFLDDVSIDQLKLELEVPIEVVEASAWGVLEGLERLADGSVDVIRCR